MFEKSCLATKALCQASNFFTTPLRWGGEGMLKKLTPNAANIIDFDIIQEKFLIDMWICLGALPQSANLIFLPVYHGR